MRVDSHCFGDLHDEALFQEIRLLGDLVVAASRMARHLTQDEVDVILELGQPTTDPHRGADVQRPASRWPR
jgi:hypothetical protein